MLRPVKAATKFKLHRLEQVIWQDNWSASGWEDWPADVDPIIPDMVTVGFLLAEDEDQIVLTQTLTPRDDQVGGVMGILKCCIVSRDIIQLP